MDTAGTQPRTGYAPINDLNMYYDIRGITTPTMLVIGDADGIRLEHAVEMFRLLGGGVFGDFAGVPPSRLAVVPGATHVGLMMQTEHLGRLIVPFLDEETPKRQGAA